MPAISRARCKQKRDALSMRWFICRNERACATLACCFELRVRLVRGKFAFRQGLWIEDLQTPPGQECSNGSMILLAVVLWRAFCV